MTIDWYYSEAGYDNSLCVFTVDDANASIDGVAASDSATYHNKAIGNTVMTLSRPLPEPGGSPPSTNQTSRVFNIGDYYSFCVKQNGGGHPHVWFPFVEGNVDDYGHFSGSNVEDLCNTPGVCPNPLGYINDADFNDVKYTAAEKLLVKADVDVDSDNNSAGGSPARNTAEESIEEDSPGKVLAVGVGQRKPAVIEAQVGADFSADDFTFTITYDSSKIRLYNSASIDTGVFIASGTTFGSSTPITKNDLLDGGATVYMDGIALGTCDITLTATKTAGDYSGNSISDKARVTVALDLDTDSDNDGTIESTQNYSADGTAEDMIEDSNTLPGNIIPLNRDDDYGSIALAFSGPSNGDLNGYELFLTCDSGLNLWADENKLALSNSSNPPDSSGNEWYVWEIDASLPSFPTTLYVEGVSAGTQHVYWILRGGGTIVAGDIVEFYIAEIDIDTDSDNDGDVDRSSAEDDLEDVNGNGVNQVGKRIFVNKDDDNTNGKTDTTDSSYIANDDDFAVVAIDAGDLDLSVLDGYRLYLCPDNGLKMYADAKKTPLSGGQWIGSWYYWEIDEGVINLPNEENNDDLGVVAIEGITTGEYELNWLLVESVGFTTIASDTVEINVEEIVYPFTTQEYQNWNERPTTDWVGIEVADAWHIDKALVDYITTPASKGQLETIHPDYDPTEAGGPLIWSTAAGDDSTTTESYGDGFTMEFDYLFETSRGDGTYGYVKIDPEKDGTPREKLSFVGNSGVKFGGVE
ncbi:MAG: hypothetical protein U9N87_04425, partial [Planctomycetota bacterium]|nr:hypothetical protein [Planctomycetota bacterium]